jgi:hypothetical protein
MKKLKYILLTILISFVFVSCEDLVVKNLNDPDFAMATSNANDLKGIAGGLVNQWFQRTHEYYGPGLGLWVMADAGTCSFGNAGMRALSNEPRLVFDNTPAYQDVIINEGLYSTMHAVISQSNDILKNTVKSDVKIIAEGGTDETPLVNAVAYFAQGISLGYLGLLYDRAYIITEDVNLTEDEIVLKPYSEVIDAAVASLEKCIIYCESNTFILPSSWIPSVTPYDNVSLGQLAHSMIARILANSPRNKAENSSVNWQKVYDHTLKGITFDFAPITDDVTWYDYYHAYADYAGWGMTDMRVVHMMDPNMPAKWPGANGFDVIPDPAVDPFDHRLLTDFEYMSSCSFKPERGYYHFSCYRHKRIDKYLETWTEPCTDMYVAENDLLKAEAALMLNRLEESASIINSGTRISRGEMPTITANAQEISDAIFHERNIELFLSGLGIEFFTMRKADLLQEGSFLHFPIPGSQLQVLKMDYYTFGADKGIPGIDVSNGGWNK